MMDKQLTFDAFIKNIKSIMIQIELLWIVYWYCIFLIWCRGIIKSVYNSITSIVINENQRWIICLVKAKKSFLSYGWLKIIIEIATIDHQKIDLISNMRFVSILHWMSHMQVSVISWTGIVRNNVEINIVYSQSEYLW